MASKKMERCSFLKSRDHTRKHFWSILLTLHNTERHSLQVLRAQLSKKPFEASESLRLSPDSSIPSPSTVSKAVRLSSVGTHLVRSYQSSHSSSPGKAETQTFVLPFSGAFPSCAWRSNLWQGSLPTGTTSVLRHTALRPFSAACTNHQRFLRKQWAFLSDRLLLPQQRFERQPSLASGLSQRRSSIPCLPRKSPSSQTSALISIQNSVIDEEERQTCYLRALEETVAEQVQILACRQLAALSVEDVCDPGQSQSPRSRRQSQSEPRVCLAFIHPLQADRCYCQHKGSHVFQAWCGWGSEVTPALRHVRVISTTLWKSSVENLSVCVEKGGGEKKLHQQPQKNIFCGCWCNFFSPPPCWE